MLRLDVAESESELEGICAYSLQGKLSVACVLRSGKTLASELRVNAGQSTGALVSQ